MDWFLGLVRQRRHIAETEIPAIRTGKVYTGRQALKVGLIDAYGDERTAREWLAKEKNISKDLRVVDVYWRKPQNWLWRFLGQTLDHFPGPGNGSLDGMISVWQPGLN